MARKRSVIDAPPDATSTPDEASPQSTTLCGEKWISRKEAREILGASGKQIPDRLLDEFLDRILLIAQTSVDLTESARLSSKKKAVRKRGTPGQRKRKQMRQGKR